MFFFLSKHQFSFSLSLVHRFHIPKLTPHPFKGFLVITHTGVVWLNLYRPRRNQPWYSLSLSLSLTHSHTHTHTLGLFCMCLFICVPLFLLHSRPTKFVINPFGLLSLWCLIYLFSFLNSDDQSQQVNNLCVRFCNSQKACRYRNEARIILESSSLKLSLSIITGSRRRVMILVEVPLKLYGYRVIMTSCCCVAMWNKRMTLSFGSLA